MFRKKIVIMILAVAMVLSCGAGKNLWAGAYDIKEMTPQVKSALEGRKERYDALKDFKQEGAIGENNRGYVEVFTSDSKVRALVQQENRDRKVIYQTIVEQNNLQGALDTIETVFADVQRKNALSGEKIQNESGQWIRK